MLYIGKYITSQSTTIDTIHHRQCISNACNRNENGKWPNGCAHIPHPPNFAWTYHEPWTYHERLAHKNLMCTKHSRKPHIKYQSNNYHQQNNNNTSYYYYYHHQQQTIINQTTIMKSTKIIAVIFLSIMCACSAMANPTLYKVSWLFVLSEPHYVG